MRESSHDRQGKAAGIDNGMSKRRAADKALDWRKAMSDHVAYALLVYTGLQILLVVKALTQGTSTLLPFAALAVLVAAIIPACRWFEKRWTDLGDREASDPAYAAAFRRDAIALWTLAAGMPVVLTLLIKAFFALF